MAKPDSTKVNSGLAQRAVGYASSRQTVYSELIKLNYQATGRLAPGCDNKDLQAWIDLNMPDVFDEKGKKKIKVT